MLIKMPLVMRRPPGKIPQPDDHLLDNILGSESPGACTISLEYCSKPVIEYAQPQSMLVYLEVILDTTWL